MCVECGHGILPCSQRREEKMQLWLDKRKALTNSFFAIIKTEVYIVIGFFWVHTRQFAFSNLSF